jgi:aspartyl-tRNA(Asn)/glutamyl-tRNA(Gln) amidotransferase subunit A
MTDIADLSAQELLAAYRARRLSPVEVVEAVCARITRLEPKIFAIWLVDHDAARAAARESEQRWRQSVPRALEGVPVTIKDNVATRGAPIPLGTAARDLVPASDDAPPAARLAEAGTILIGKTTMPDYGMLSSGLSSFHALARNPWNLAKNPGGSSAGAGAAAAAGYGPLHVGTDIGGSIRLPASWCGIVGHKPSLGRIPIDPPYYGRVAGPMTRTVADSALMMRELSRPDIRDTMSLPPQEIDWLDLDRDVKGLRLGIWLDAGFGLPMEPAVRRTIEDAAKRFSDAGAIIESIPPFLTREMIDGLDKFWRQRAWSDIGSLSPDKRAKVLPYILAWAEGGRSLTGAEVYHGMSQMMAMREAAVRATRHVDFLISPTAPCVTYAAEWASPLNDPARPFDHIAFTVAFNMSEQPSISLNADYDTAGLPIGLQITGRRFDDLGVLRLARAWERLRPPQRPWPIVA